MNNLIICQLFLVLLTIVHCQKMAIRKKSKSKFLVKFNYWNIDINCHYSWFIFIISYSIVENDMIKLNDREKIGICQLSMNLIQFKQ